MTRRSSLTTFLLTTAICTAPAVAESSGQSFDDIFGTEAAKVAKSTDSKASAAFAAKLLKYSSQLKDEPALAKVLLEKAYEFGSKSPAGYAIAISAARERQKRDDASKSAWQDKILSIMRQQHQHADPASRAKLGEDLVAELCDTGDELCATGQYEQALKLFQEASRVAAACKSPMAEEVNDKLKAATARVAAARKLKTLEEKLAAKPDDAPTAKTAVLLCLTQLDDPDRAAKYSEASGDDAIRKFVPLASKKPAELSPDEALGLGDWLCSLAEKGEKASKIALLTRTKKCYEEIVSRDEKGVNGIAADRKLDQTLRKLALLHLGERKITLDLGKGATLKIVLVPAGQVKVKDMGTIKRTLTVSKSVYIGATEVTRRQFQAIMGGTEVKGDDASLPIADVLPDKAEEFCKKLAKKTGYSARLPSGAEWEFAARAGSEADYGIPHAQDLGEYAWFDSNSKQTAHSVAAKAPNAFGLYDMLGNVWEWCDSAEETRGGSRSDPKAQPKPAAKGYATRGGSYADAKAFLTCSSKVDRPADFTNETIGFRVAVEAKE